MYKDSEFTYIDDADMWQCNNCGAYATTREAIQHHSTCKPGEAEYWEEFYTSNSE